jgi:hypothetical protein
MAERHRREQVSARLDPEVVEIVESVAQAERRPVSALVRNIPNRINRINQSNGNALSAAIAPRRQSQQFGGLDHGREFACIQTTKGADDGALSNP